MGRRPEKIGNEMMHIMGGIIRENYLPDYPDVLVTVTSVKVTEDLKEARILCSFYSEDEARREELFQRMRRDVRKIRAGIAAGLVIKFMPRITILKDESQEYAEKINRLLREI